MIAGPLSETIAKDLAAKLAQDQLVLFVGAGISLQAPAGDGSAIRMPLWRDLAAKVASATSESLDAYHGDILIFFDAVKASFGRDRLEDEVRRALQDDQFVPGRTHELIASLPWNLVYTTNYDSLLKRAMNEIDAVVREEDYERFRRPPERRPRLIHLHGDLRDMHTLTGIDYNEWPEVHPRAKSHLLQTGLDKTFLFVGYSNSDPHLQRGIFPLIRRMGPRHGRGYAWMYRATPQQINVLDREYSLDVTSLSDDVEWERAFEQVSHYYNLLKTNLPAKSAVGSKASGITKKTRINGHKLFFHRATKRVSLSELSQKSGITPRRLRRLERVKEDIKPSDESFALASLQEIDAIERALGCRGQLQTGMDDDFLASYLMFSRVNRGAMSKKESNSQLHLTPSTQAIVFDFGGTLTLPSSRHNTWERMWLSVGYDLAEAAELHQLFNAGRIDHQMWCDLTRDKLRERGFSRANFEEVVSTIKPVPGLDETFQLLAKKAIPIFIVSGSIKGAILKVLGSSFQLVDEVKSNDLIFDEKGIIKEIRGHEFDFEGKAKFVETVIKSRRCLPVEVLFVGNSLNDHWAIRSGCRTLCVNPSHTDYTNSLVWTTYIKDMKDLTEILGHI